MGGTCCARSAPETKERKMPKAKSQSAQAATEADIILCAQPAPNPVVLPETLSPFRAYAIRVGAKKWVNGTVLHYHFLDRSTDPKWKWVEDQRKVVRWAFGVWKK